MKQTRTKSASKASPCASTTVGFRLDEESHRLLCERAACLNISPHELARDQVKEALQGGEQDAGLATAIGLIHDEVAQLRVDVATATEALLMAAGKTKAEEARAWVRENLL